MDLKEYYREEIRRRKLEGDQGDGVSLAQLEAEFAKLLESEQSSPDMEAPSSSGAHAGSIAPKLTLDSTQLEEEIPEFVREEQPYYAIDGYPYDDFFGAIEGGMRGASRHGKIGVDRSGKVYARDGVSDLDKRLVELKWEYEQNPERRDEIAAEAARLRAQHEGEYTVTEEMPLSQFQLLESDFLKELQSGPPALEAPPIPEEEISAAIDEEYYDEPEFRNAYGPEFRNAPEWIKPPDDPISVQGRAEGERILEEIKNQYLSENPTFIDDFFDSTFGEASPQYTASVELQQAIDDPELLLKVLDAAPTVISSVRQARQEGVPMYTKFPSINMLLTIFKAFLQDSIDGNEKPGPFTTLFSKKSENISKAQQKKQLFSEKDYYAKLGPTYIPQREVFMDRIEKKIEDIEKNMPQKYDDLEQDKRYRDAVLYPLKYTLMVNRNFDDFFAVLTSAYNRIDNSY